MRARERGPRHERLARLWRKVDIYLFDLNATNWRDMTPRQNARRIRWEGLRGRLSDAIREEAIRHWPKREGNEA